MHGKSFEIQERNSKDQESWAAGKITLILDSLIFPYRKFFFKFTLLTVYILRLENDGSVVPSACCIWSQHTYQVGHNHI